MLPPQLRIGVQLTKEEFIEEFENNEDWEGLDEYVDLANGRKLILLEETLAEQHQFKVQNFS
jgi:hypothetical protein